jgi:hypothetical protein
MLVFYDDNLDFKIFGRVVPVEDSPWVLTHGSLE